MKYKYIILDFGNVIAKSPSGDWDIIPKFEELIDINKMNKSLFERVRKKYSYILSYHAQSLEEEYNLFLEYYDSILSNIKYEGYNKHIAEEIAYERTYTNKKYVLIDNIHNELAKLKEKYKLILLTDNWPCVIPYLKDNNLDVYFEKVYVSSIYKCVKKDGIFFDYPIKDFNINPKEALFIDDAEENLSAAVTRGLDVLLMDRDNKIKKSKYQIIHDLNNI